jgi:hypothetical protein
MSAWEAHSSKLRRSEESNCFTKFINQILYHLAQPIVWERLFFSILRGTRGRVSSSSSMMLTCCLLVPVSSRRVPLKVSMLKML